MVGKLASRLFPHVSATLRAATIRAMATKLASRLFPHVSATLRAATIRAMATKLAFRLFPNVNATLRAATIRAMATKLASRLFQHANATLHLATMRGMVTKLYSRLLPLLFVVIPLLAGCKAKDKIVESSNEFIVFLARLTLMAMVIAIIGNSAMYIIRAKDGENPIPANLWLRLIVIIILTISNIAIPQVFDTVVDATGFNLLPAALGGRGGGD